MPARTGTVLSGKGGSGKTTLQSHLAAAASCAEVLTLLVDLDPEKNLSTRQGINQHATGVGDVLIDAGVMSGVLNRDAGAKRLRAEIVPSKWEHVDLLPAGASLLGVAEVTITDLWLLRDMLEEAGVYEQYECVLIDTAGRRGSTTNLAMYAADVAYAAIGPDDSHVRKALEAHERVKAVYRAHPLEWAGVVISGCDLNTGMHDAVHAEAMKMFGELVRADIPRRAVVNETYQLAERLGDRRDVKAANLARIFHGFLMRDVLGRPGQPAGVLR